MVAPREIVVNLGLKLLLSLVALVLFCCWRTWVWRGRRARVLAVLEDTYYLVGRDVGLLANVPTGSLYVILARLEDQKLVESYLQPGGPERVNRPRRFYIRTKKGRAQLDSEAHMRARRQ